MVHSSQLCEHFNGSNIVLLESSVRADASQDFRIVPGVPLRLGFRKQFAKRFRFRYQRLCR